MKPVENDSRETILVVDDNAEVLKTVAAVLSNAGFVVLTARCGEDALALAASISQKIHLLLSDVSMPLMSGPALGQAMKNIRPDLHVMLMSGGAIDGSLLVLNYGWPFIEKPFIMKTLIDMVADVLHQTDRSERDGNEFESRKDRLIAPGPAG